MDGSTMRCDLKYLSGKKEKPWRDKCWWKCGGKRHGWFGENMQKWLGLFCPAHMTTGTHGHGKTMGVVCVGTPFNVQGTWAYRYTLARTG